MKKKLFDNSRLQQDIEWGNIPVGGLTDQELHSKNWEAVTKGRANAQDPVWQERQRLAQQQRQQSDWAKKMIGNKNGLNSPRMSGQTHTEETKQKLSKLMTGRDHASITGVPKERVTCPYCNKTGGRPQMFQWHFDRCKHK